MQSLKIKSDHFRPSTVYGV